MSVHVMSWARRLRLGPRSIAPKAVLGLLADNASDDGACWPGVALLADELCISERSVRRHIDFLEGLGVLSRYRRSIGARRLNDGLQLHLDVTNEMLAERLDARADEGAGTDDRPSPDAASDVREDPAKTPESRQPDNLTARRFEPVDNSGSAGAYRTTTTGLPDKLGRAYKEEPSGEPSILLPEVSYDGAGHVEHEEDDPSSSSGQDVGAALRRVHAGLSLDAVTRRLVASGVDPASVDLVAAATSVVEARRGQRIGDVSAYVATSVAREPWRWPVGGGDSWAAAVAAARPVGCAEGAHRWVALAGGGAFCGVCSAEDGVGARRDAFTTVTV